MNTHRRTAIIVGTLFIIGTVVLISSGVFSESIHSPDYLNAVAANQNNVITAALIELISAAAIVGIPIALYPYLKRYSQSLSVGYLTARIFEVVFLVAGTVIMLTLLSLSQEYVASASTASTFYGSAGALLLATRGWCGILLDFPFTISAVILNYVFLKTLLVPKWLSVWGIIGAALWLALAPLRLFGFETPMIEVLALPIAAQEMALAVWLIVKGFKVTNHEPRI